MIPSYRPQAPWTDAELDLIFQQAYSFVHIQRKGAAAVTELQNQMPERELSEISDTLRWVVGEMPIVNFYPPRSVPEYMQ